MRVLEQDSLSHHAPNKQRDAYFSLGDDVGSANIDGMFEKLAAEKLEKLGYERLGLKSPKEIPRTAWRMRLSDDLQN
ncbi:hypothetical protein PG985_015845 [Apiospora marii]|uniref:uncharacterized protein n=1 Tax=Apiospora marii TaxID=335849 RepID=UPI003130FB0B